MHSQTNLGDSLRDATPAALCCAAEPRTVRTRIIPRIPKVTTRLINYVLMVAFLERIASL